MKRHLIIGVLAGLFTAIATMGAQTAVEALRASQVPAAPPTATAPPAPTSAPAPSPERVSRSDSARAITVEGCVAKEADVPGRKASTKERAGIGDDYLLVDVKTSAESTPAAASKETMFEIEGLDHETLTSHLGARVQLQGNLGSIDSGIFEIRAASIKRVPGRCASSP